MDKDLIAKKVHSVVKEKLYDVPFDKGLPELRKILWNIADEYEIEGSDVFRIYMDWYVKQKK